jgi:hypothetical protein
LVSDNLKGKCSCVTNILSRVQRLYKTGFGLTTGFIGSQSVTQLGYSVLHFTTHNNWVSSLLLKTSDPTLQPLLQPTLMASLAITILVTRRNSVPYWLSQSYFTTDDLSVSPSWCRAPSRAHDQILITIWHLLFCHLGPSLWLEVGSVICISHLDCFSSVILLLAFASYFISDCLWSAFFKSKRHKPSHHVKGAVHGEGLTQWPPTSGYIAREQTTKKTPSPIPLLLHDITATDPKKHLLLSHVGCPATVVNKHLHCWLLTRSVHVTISSA